MIVLHHIYVFSFKTSRKGKYISTKISVLVAVCYGYANDPSSRPRDWPRSRGPPPGAGRRLMPPAHPVTGFAPPYPGICARFLLNKGCFRWFGHRGTEKDEILTDSLFWEVGLGQEPRGLQECWRCVFSVLSFCNETNVEKISHIQCSVLPLYKWRGKKTKFIISKPSRLSFLYRANSA